jgi:hypothetical protein
MNPLRNLNLSARLRGNTRPLALAAFGAAALAAPAVAPAVAQAEVKEFPQEVRHLHGFWANEHVPAYKCPSDSHRFLENKSYAPAGTSLPRGVSVNQEREPWPIGVSITGLQTMGVSKTGNREPWVLGTESGFGRSSATNWAGGDQWYQVVLHCTNDKTEGYQFHLPV